MEFKEENQISLSYVSKGNNHKQLPDNWSVKKLGDISSFKQGYQIPYSQQETDYKDGYIRYLYISDFFSDSKKLYINDSDKYFKICPRDICVANTGNTGGKAFRGAQGVLSNNMFKISINPSEVDCDFYWHFLNSGFYWNQLLRMFNSGGQPHVGHNNMSRISILLPPLNEQQKIAEILSTWDKGIELKKKLIEQKKEQKKGLILFLFSGLIRVHEMGEINEQVTKRIDLVKVGLIPDGYQKTKLGIIPNEWRVVRLKDKFKRLTKKNDSNNSNVLTISAQYGLISQEEFFNKLVASKDLTNYFLLQKGDFAYNKSYSKGYPYGAIKVLEEYENGVVSPLYICFSPNKTNKYPEFYKYYFEFGFYNHEIHAIAQEGARNHGLLNVSVSDFFNGYILDMDEKEMKLITVIVSKAAEEIELLEQELETIRLQKKGLMQLLLTGKVRVNVDASTSPVTRG